MKTPTPLVADDLIVLSGGYRGRPIFALKPGGEGDLTKPERGYLAWKSDAGGPYTSTPVVYRGLLYSMRNYWRRTSAVATPRPT